MLTVAEINERLAVELFGWEPGQPCSGGFGGELPDSAEGWFCAECGHVEGWGDDYSHDRKVPDVLSDWNGAQRVVEGMGRRGYDIQVNVLTGISDYPFDCAMKRSRPYARSHADAESLPRAVALAAVWALEDERDGAHVSP